MAFSSDTLLAARMIYVSCHHQHLSSLSFCLQAAIGQTLNAILTTNIQAKLMAHPDVHPTLACASFNQGKGLYLVLLQVGWRTRYFPFGGRTMMMLKCTLRCKNVGCKNKIGKPNISQPATRSTVWIQRSIWTQGLCAVNQLIDRRIASQINRVCCLVCIASFETQLGKAASKAETKPQTYHGVHELDSQTSIEFRWQEWCKPSDLYAPDSFLRTESNVGWSETSMTPWDSPAVRIDNAIQRDAKQAIMNDFSYNDVAKPESKFSKLGWIHSRCSWTLNGWCSSSYDQYLWSTEGLWK